MTEKRFCSIVKEWDEQLQPIGSVKKWRLEVTGDSLKEVKQVFNELNDA